MASISHTAFSMNDTPKGVRIDMTLYYYPDSHGNLLDGDGNNFPIEGDNAIHAHFVEILDQAKKRMRARKLPGVI